MSANTGVAVWRVGPDTNPGFYPDDGEDRDEWRAIPAEPGTWYPLAVANRLIDVDDPKVRERLEDMFADDERTDELVDEVLSRLKEANDG